MMWTRGAAFIAAMLLAGGTARAAYVWQDDTDGNGFACMNVGTLQVNDMAGAGSRCVEVTATGQFIPMSVPCGTGTVTSVTGANGLICSPTSPNPTCTLSTATCSANAFVNATSSGSGLVCVQPTIANLANIPANTIVCNPTSGAAAPTTSSTLKTDGTRLSVGQSSLDGGLHAVLTDDTTPTTVTAWDARHAVLGQSGSSGAGLGISYQSSTSTAYISALTPNVAWDNIRVDALTFAVYSSGGTLGLFQDSGGNAYDSVLTSNGLLKTSGGNGKHAIASPADVAAAIAWPVSPRVLISGGISAAPVGDSTFTFDTGLHGLAAGNFVGINGASVPANTALTVGNTTNANRDRVQFLLGGGALGATGTGDNTLLDVNPSATVITAGVTAGIYATQRIRAISYSGGGTSLTEAATLYVDGAPSLGGGISSTAIALHVASGQTKVGGSLTSTLLVAGGVTAVDTTGTFGIAGVGGLPAAVTGEQNYFIAVTGSTLVTGANVFLATSSSAGFAATAIEYEHSFAASTVALKVHIIANAITSGTLAIRITRNGATFGTLTLNNVSSGTISTGSLTVGSPVIGDQWGVAANGTGTGMTGNMQFTGTLLLAPNVF